MSDYLLLMKYILTERQFKTILEEEKNPIPINLSIDSEKIKKYCKKNKIPKQIIDSKLSSVGKIIDSNLENEKKEILTRFPEARKFGKSLDRIIAKLRPILVSITQKVSYDITGHITYNFENDMNKVFSIVYDEINQELNGSLLYKTMASAFITKNNAEGVKQILKRILDGFGYTVRSMIMWIQVSLLIGAAKEFREQLPLCKEVIIVADEKSNKLDPSKQYHPKEPIFLNVNNISERFDFEPLKGPYVTKMFALVDSFV